MNKTILFIEDGSVDVDDVKEALPGIELVVYRQGAPMPTFVDVEVSDPCEGICEDTDKEDATPRFKAEEVRSAIKKTFKEICKKTTYSPFATQYQTSFILNEALLPCFIDDVITTLTEGADPSDDK